MRHYSLLWSHSSTATRPQAGDFVVQDDIFAVGVVAVQQGRQIGHCFVKQDPEAAGLQDKNRFSAVFMCKNDEFYRLAKYPGEFG